MTRYLIVLLAFSVTCVRGATAADTKQVSELELTVAAAETYVEGGPMIVAIEIKSTWDGYRGFGFDDTWFPTRLDFRGEPFIVRLASPGEEGEIILKGKYPTVRPLRDRIALGKDERCRMLVDLANLGPAPRTTPAYLLLPRTAPVYALPAGHYDVTVVCLRQDSTFPGRPFHIRVAQASQGDRAVLERIRKAAPRQFQRTWAHGIASVDDPDTFNGASPQLLSAMKPYLFLREVVRAKSLADVTTTHLAEMGKTHLAPEAAAWWYELLVARGDEPGAATLRETIQKHCPGLAWRLKEVEAGGTQFPSFSNRLRPRRKTATRE